MDSKEDRLIRKEDRQDNEEKRIDSEEDRLDRKEHRLHSKQDRLHSEKIGWIVKRQARKNGRGQYKHKRGQGGSEEDRLDS